MIKNRRGQEETGWTTVVSTLSTFVLALTALITVYITLTALGEEREARRPYLTMLESPQVSLNDDLSLEFKFYNVGVHPAGNLHSRTLVFNEGMEFEPVHSDAFEVVNEIPQNGSSSLIVSIDSRVLNPKERNIDPNYVVIRLAYDDPILRKGFEQTVYFKWNGVKEGLVQPLVHVQTEEKAQILNYLHEHHLVLDPG